MFNLKTPIIAIACLLLSTLSFALDNVDSQYNHSLTPNVMIVLDASDDMASDTSESSKMTVARQVIHKLMPEWNKDIAVGLTVYGHRHEKRCDDVEVLVPVSHLHASEVQHQIDHIQAEGSTPLTAAVRQAAEALNYTEEKATVILISGGKESCKADPCILSRELKSQGLDFTAHVIGFDIAPGEDENLRCLAENTGGAYYAVDTAEQLKMALDHITHDLNGKTAIPNVFLTAELGYTHKVINHGLRWRVLSERTDLEGEHKVLEHTNVAQPELAMPPGKYIVEVEYGNTKVKEPIDIVLNENTTKVININAGVVRLGAKSSNGSSLLEKGVRWYVTEPKPTIEGKYPLISYSSKSAPIFDLAAGDYRLEAKFGSAGQEWFFSVSPGEEKEKTINFNAGLLKIECIASTKNPALDKKTRVWIYENNHGEPGTLVHYSRRPEMSHWLAKGDYIIKAEYGAARTQQDISVAAGEISRHILNFHAGVVELHASNKNLEKPRWWIKSAGEENKRVAYSNQAEPQFLLQAGQYQVVLRSKQQEELSKLITVKEGQRIEVGI